VKLRGDFAWLAAAPAHRERNIGVQKATNNAEAIITLRRSSTQLLQLPKAFIKFMETPSLQERIRSNTDCFLDLCSAPVPSPVGDGCLIRFLADPQGCIFWYLYLTGEGSDHAVVSSPRFYGMEVEPWENEQYEPGDIVFSAESFEEFMCRFWIEKEIWYSGWEKAPMPDVGLDYIERYRQGTTSTPAGPSPDGSLDGQ
jgi:hypothetical protein